MICPQCGEPCERDTVDVGVGEVATGPWGCPSCQWVEGTPATRTPDLTALEQWARNWWCRIFSQEIADAVLALCETVREQQAELTKWQTCSGCGETMDAPGHCSNAETEWNKAHMEIEQQAFNDRDAAVARAEQAERERDALMVRVDQWRRMADREVTACVEMRAERDAALAERDALAKVVATQASALTEARRVLESALPHVGRVWHGSDAPPPVYIGELRTKIAAVLAQEGGEQ